MDQIRNMRDPSLQRNVIYTRLYTFKKFAGLIISSPAPVIHMSSKIAFRVVGCRGRYRISERGVPGIIFNY